MSNNSDTKRPKPDILATTGGDAPPSQAQWYFAMRQLVKHEMFEQGLSYTDIARRLSLVTQNGFNTSAVKNRINRGRFSAAFLVQVLMSIDRAELDLALYAPSPNDDENLLPGQPMAVSDDARRALPVKTPVYTMTPKQWGAVVSKTVRHAMCEHNISYEELFKALADMEINCGDVSRLRERIEYGRFNAVFFVQIFSAMAQGQIELHMEGVRPV